MKMNLRNLKELIGLEINNIDFILTELIDWINNYDYSYEIISWNLVRKDLQVPSANTKAYTIYEFILDWKKTLNDKAESYFGFLDMDNEDDVNSSENFKVLLKGLDEIECKLSSLNQIVS